ncbi:MAG: efflux RND transporter permease subunit, partial [bacterium]|nr:efflux RND transporter permease subunit [bacterium]
MKSAIIWMGKNPVVANMVVVLLLVGGYFSLQHIKILSWPDFPMDQIVVMVPYPGASPEDVEEGVCKRIEEHLAGLEGVRGIHSMAAEGVGTVTVEVAQGADIRRLLDDVKVEVDRIDTFPVEADKPVVKEVVRRNRVIDVVVYGEVPERTLKTIAQRVRDDMRVSGHVSLVDLVGVRSDEISIEISEANLRRFGLTFDQVRLAVARTSMDLPGGSVKGEGGEILVRTKGIKYRGQDYEDVVILMRPDGTSVTLGQVATVVDDFEDSDLACRFNGQPAAVIQVSRMGDQSVLEISDYVRKYILEQRSQLPANVHIDFALDEAVPLRSRLDLVLSNAWMGLILVLICLSLFLELHLAFWVMLGIPISFMGCFILMQPLGASISMISLFGFIVALGIVVDDAIVVGESVFAYRERVEGRYTRRERGGAGSGPVSDEITRRRRKVFMRAAIDGVLDVSTPVVFSVLTTLVAFLPLLFVGGMIGKFLREIPLIVIPVLTVSLFESLFILPAHLTARHGGKAYVKFQNWMAHLFRWHTWARNRVDAGLKYFIENQYAQALRLSLGNPFATLAVGVALLLVTVGWVAGGHSRFIFLPKVDADWVTVAVTMPQGTTASQTGAVVRRIEEGAAAVRAEYDGEWEDDRPSVLRSVFSFVGDQPMARKADLGASQTPSPGSNAHLAEVTLVLSPAQERNFPSSKFAERLRQEVGEIPGVESIEFQSSALAVGSPIEVEVASADPAKLKQAVERLKAEIASYPGTSDIHDSFKEGKQELRLSLKPHARTLGLAQADLARQVRQGFYGAEVLRLQRGSEEVKVMVRYPKAERRSLHDVENMRIRTATGAAVPFSNVADVHLQRGQAAIFRSDRQSVVTVMADVEEKVANAETVIEDLTARVLPSLAQDYPGLRYSFVGQRREQKESLETLAQGFTAALIVIFGLLAIPFRSYFQPLVVMCAIPFGIIGAIWGHAILGMDLTMLSMFGLVALSGVVVNDS